MRECLKTYSDFILGANSQIFRGDFIKKIYNEAISEIIKKNPKKPKNRSAINAKCEYANATTMNFNFQN